jgi:hypothetical protein
MQLRFHAGKTISERAKHRSRKKRVIITKEGKSKLKKTVNLRWIKMN